MLGWAGLRGHADMAVTFPVSPGSASRGRVLDRLPFVVVTLDPGQGASFEPLAKRLGLPTTAALPQRLSESGRIQQMACD